MWRSSLQRLLFAVNDAEPPGNLNFKDLLTFAEITRQNEAAASPRHLTIDSFLCFLSPLLAGLHKRRHFKGTKQHTKMENRNKDIKMRKKVIHIILGVFTIHLCRFDIELGASMILFKLNQLSHLYLNFPSLSLGAARLIPESVEERKIWNRKLWQGHSVDFSTRPFFANPHCVSRGKYPPDRRD